MGFDWKKAASASVPAMGATMSAFGQSRSSGSSSSSASALNKAIAQQYAHAMSLLQSAYDNQMAGLTRLQKYSRRSIRRDTKGLVSQQEQMLRQAGLGPTTVPASFRQAALTRMREQLDKLNATIRSQRDAAKQQLAVQMAGLAANQPIVAQPAFSTAGALMSNLGNLMAAMGPSMFGGGQSGGNNANFSQSGGFNSLFPGTASGGVNAQSAAQRAAQPSPFAGSGGFDAFAPQTAGPAYVPTSYYTQPGALPNLGPTVMPNANQFTPTADPFRAYGASGGIATPTATGNVAPVAAQGPTGAMGAYGATSAPSFGVGAAGVPLAGGAMGALGGLAQYAADPENAGQRLNPGGISALVPELGFLDAAGGGFRKGMGLGLPGLGGAKPEDSASGEGGLMMTPGRVQFDRGMAGLTAPLASLGFRGFGAQGSVGPFYVPNAAQMAPMMDFGFQNMFANRASLFGPTGVPDLSFLGLGKDNSWMNSLFSIPSIG